MLTSKPATTRRTKPAPAAPAIITVVETFAVLVVSSGCGELVGDGVGEPLGGAVGGEAVGGELSVIGLKAGSLPLTQYV